MKLLLNPALLNALCVVSLAVGAAACSVEAPAEYKTNEQGLEIPDDPDLQWLANEPWTGITFAESCKSVSSNGSTITDEPLPVGDGAHIECTTSSNVVRHTMGTTTQSHGHWCALGELIGSKPGGDSRLSISVSSPPSTTGFSLTAVTAPGQAPFGLKKVEAFGGYAWPLWLEVTYRTIDMRPEVPGQNCNELFGL
jgi:hypothetical protein